MVNWLVANPTHTLKEGAEFFGWTPTFMYMLVNSDMFQAALRARQAEVGACVVGSVRDRLMGLAAQTMDAISERVAMGTASERLLGDTFGKTLAALGYGAPQSPGGGNTLVQVNVSAEDLRKARERGTETFEGKSVGKQHDGTDSFPPATAPSLREAVAGD